MLCFLKSAISAIEPRESGSVLLEKVTVTRLSQVGITLRRLFSRSYRKRHSDLRVVSEYLGRMGQGGHKRPFDGLL